MNKSTKIEQLRYKADNKVCSIKTISSKPIPPKPLYKCEYADAGCMIGITCPHSWPHVSNEDCGGFCPHIALVKKVSGRPKCLEIK